MTQFKIQPKRLLAWVLSLALVLGLMPGYALADEKESGITPTGTITGFIAPNDIQVEIGTGESDIPFPAEVIANVQYDGEVEQADTISVGVGAWNIAFGEYDANAEDRYVFEVVRDSLIIPDGVTLPDDFYELPCVAVEVGEVVIEQAATAATPITDGGTLTFDGTALTCSSATNFNSQEAASLADLDGDSTTWYIGTGAANDGDLNTLYLYNFEYSVTSADVYYGFIITGTAVIDLKGDNSITMVNTAGTENATNGIRVAAAGASLTIEGVGKLTVEASGSTKENVGVYCNRPFTMSGGTLDTYGASGTNSSYGLTAYNGFTMTGGTIIAESGTGHDELGYYGAMYIGTATAPEGVIVKGGANSSATETLTWVSSKVYTYSGGTTAALYAVMTVGGGDITLTGDETLDLTSVLTDKTYLDGSGGKAEWNAADTELTLTNFNFSTTGVDQDYPIALKLPAGSTIILPAGTENSLISSYDRTTAQPQANGASYGIYAEGTLTIKGEGKLTVSGGKAIFSVGIYAQTSIAVTNSEVTTSGFETDNFPDESYSQGLQTGYFTIDGATLTCVGGDSEKSRGVVVGSGTTNSSITNGGKLVAKSMPTPAAYTTQSTAILSNYDAELPASISVRGGTSVGDNQKLFYGDNNYHVGSATGAIATYAVATVAGAVPDKYEPLTIASGFGTDIIAEIPGSIAANSTTGPFDSLDDNFALYSVSFYPTSGGLPNDGKVIGISTPSVEYQLAPYNQNNALRLDLKSPGSSNVGTLTLSTVGAYEGISVLGASASGAAWVDVMVNYTDGSSDTERFGCKEWFFMDGYVVSGMRRVNRTLTTPEARNNGPNLYQYQVDTDPTKLIKSITFTEASMTNAEDQGQYTNNGGPGGSRADGSTTVVLMAVSGIVSGDAPESPTAKAATSTNSSGFTANWDAASDATKYYLDVSEFPDFSTLVDNYNNKDVGNVTSYAVTGLQTGVTYYYRVRAANSSGQSMSSNTITVTVSGGVTGYTVTVNGSYAGVTGAGRYERNDKVTINAGSRSNYSFNGWTVTSGGVTLENARSATTTFTMPANAVTVTASWRSSGGGSGGGGGGTSAQTPDKPTSNVIVDGKEIDAGKVEINRDVTSVTVNQEIIEKQLETATDNVTVIVPAGSGTAVAQLVVQNVDEMAAKEMSLTVQVGDVQYEIPTTAIDTAGILSALGAENPADVPISISITTNVSEAAQAAVESAVKADGSVLVIPPMEFKITASYDGKEVEIDVFSQYVSRSIELTAEQAARITTAVIVDADGTTRQVPTRVYEQNGKWYAEINSLTNSVYAIVFNETAFADANGKWYEAAVNEMGSRMIISGVGEGLFAGERDITRAEFSAIVVRALGLPATGDGSAFGDVSGTAWYSGAVGTAYEYGIVSGVGNGLFAPERKISRQEAMVMIQRAAKITGFAGATGDINSFTDAGDVAAWASQAVGWNVGSGLVSGSGGKLNPTSDINRAETATLVLKLMQKAGLVDIRTRF